VKVLSLHDRTVLVTGASSGIGRAVTITIDRLGGRPILLGRRKEELERTQAALEHDSSAYQYDLADTEGIGTLIASLATQHGPFDGFVHCAGITPTTSLTALSPKIVDKVMRVNVYAFLEGCRHLTARDRFRPGMSIVGISSVSARRAVLGKTAYCSSKAALDAAARCLARELAPKQIRVNTIAAGFVATSRVTNMLADAPESVELRANLQRQYLGLTEPDDLTAAVAFLLSPASSAITGTSMDVDGGFLSS